jgi:mannose-6-phosphate isomerase
MKTRDSFHCLPGTVHRMVAVTDVDVVEVSTPELDDVVRLEDVYGREGTSKA